LIPLSEPTILLVVLIYEEGGFQLITVACSLANTFAGIAPHDVPLFIAAQLIGAGLAALTARWLFSGDQ